MPDANDRLSLLLGLSRVREVPLFAALPDEAAEFLGARARFGRVADKEQILPADRIWVIRAGHVVVCRNGVRGERPIACLGAGDFFDDVELPAYLRKGTLTYRARGPVELVSIENADFGRIRPYLEAGLQKSLAGIETYEGGRFEEYLDQGLHEAKSLLVIDLEACTRCDDCTRVCADSHDGVARMVRDGARFGNFLVATSCRSCDSAPCIPACPAPPAIHRGRLGEIVIEDDCTGCGECVRACPQGAVTLQGSAGPDGLRLATAKVSVKAATCDLCGGKPRCVWECPHGAAYRIDGPGLLRMAT